MDNNKTYGFKEAEKESYLDFHEGKSHKRKSRKKKDKRKKELKKLKKRVKALEKFQKKITEAYAKNLYDRIVNSESKEERKALLQSQLPW